MRKLRICAIPAGTGGVAFYRIKQPYGYLQDQGFADVFIFDNKIHDSDRLRNEQTYADIIIFQCPWSEGILESIRLIKKGDRFKKRLVVAEFDDDLFSVSPWNEKYHLFGTQPVTITYHDKENIDGIKKAVEGHPWIETRILGNGSLEVTMWRDGHGGLDIEANLAKKAATEAIIREVDVVTCTTKELGKRFRKIRKKGDIAVLPNLVDFDRFLPMKVAGDNTIRIGWQGGSAHFEDLHAVANDIVEIAQKYPKVRFIFKGIQYNALFKDIMDQVEWHPWHGDIATYPLDVRDMKLDIGLCPLVDNAFNRGKSPLKWEEYSAMKIPTIASPTVYADEIDYGKTGFIANKGEWFDRMEELILSPSLRKDMAERAYNRVKFKFGVHQAKSYIEVLEKMVANKKVLRVA